MADSCLRLEQWSLPEEVCESYREIGVTELFQWQAECLNLPGVLLGRNLVYSAPTSAGKTLVAELLLLRKLLDTKKKAIFIVPFVSMAREKTNYLQRVFGASGLVVEGFMGSQAPVKGMAKVDVAVCTIEKANNICNRLLQEGSLSSIALVVVDELHLVSDGQRGYLLELLLTKLQYSALVTSKSDADVSLSDVDSQECSTVCLTDCTSLPSTNQSIVPKPASDQLQIIGMSATLPNLSLLADWLHAALYVTTHRPVPLQHVLLSAGTFYDPLNMSLVRKMDTSVQLQNDPDYVIQACLETVLEGYSALVFCSTRTRTEVLALAIAKQIYLVGSDSSRGHPWHSGIRATLDGVSLARLLETLQRTPAGLDRTLACSLQYGAAFHHAGLTVEERDILEASYRAGIVRVLVATTTLSSGVNLPARRVIVRSPTMATGKLLDPLTYHQMAGRAGRKGVDTQGESVLVCCGSRELAAGQQLVHAPLPPVTSCLAWDSGSLSNAMKRAILEVIVSGAARSVQEVQLYCRCTLLAACLKQEQEDKNHFETLPVSSCIKYLIDNEFISSTEGALASTQLGRAVLSSGLSPEEGLAVFRQLHSARQALALDTDFHLVMLVTPIYLSCSPDWLSILAVWEGLPSPVKRVAKMLGIRESFLVQAVRGTVNIKVEKQSQQLHLHKRFVTALALHDLLQEIPLSEVANKYRIDKGLLQSLQHSASSFAGMVHVFCSCLGWRSLALLIREFERCLHLGVSRELSELAQLPCLNSKRARLLYNAGFTNLHELAECAHQQLLAVLVKGTPFASRLHCDDIGVCSKGASASDGAPDGRKFVEGGGGLVWVEGVGHVTLAQEANLILQQARNLLMKNLGAKNITWRGNSPQAHPCEDKSTVPCAVDNMKSNLEISTRTPFESNEDTCCPNLVPESAGISEASCSGVSVVNSSVRKGTIMTLPDKSEAGCQSDLLPSVCDPESNDQNVSPTLSSPNQNSNLTSPLINNKELCKSIEIVTKIATNDKEAQSSNCMSPKAIMNTIYLQLSQTKVQNNGCCANSVNVDVVSANVSKELYTNISTNNHSLDNITAKSKETVIQLLSEKASDSARRNYSTDFEFSDFDVDFDFETQQFQAGKLETVHSTELSSRSPNFHITDQSASTVALVDDEDSIIACTLSPWTQHSPLLENCQVNQKEDSDLSIGELNDSQMREMELSAFVSFTDDDSRARRTSEVIYSSAKADAESLHCDFDLPKISLNDVETTVDYRSELSCKNRSTPIAHSCNVPERLDKGKEVGSEINSNDKPRILRELSSSETSHSNFDGELLENIDLEDWSDCSTIAVKDISFQTPAHNCASVLCKNNNPSSACASPVLSKNLSGLRISESNAKADLLSNSDFASIADELASSWTLNKDSCSSPTDDPVVILEVVKNQPKAAKMKVMKKKEISTNLNTSSEITTNLSIDDISDDDFSRFVSINDTPTSSPKRGQSGVVEKLAVNNSCANNLLNNPGSHVKNKSSAVFLEPVQFERDSHDVSDEMFDDSFRVPHSAKEVILLPASRHVASAGRSKSCTDKNSKYHRTVRRLQQRNGRLNGTVDQCKKEECKINGNEMIACLLSKRCDSASESSKPCGSAASVKTLKRKIDFDVCEETDIRSFCRTKSNFSVDIKNSDLPFTEQNIRADSGVHTNEASAVSSTAFIHSENRDLGNHIDCNVSLNIVSDSKETKRLNIVRVCDDSEVFGLFVNEVLQEQSVSLSVVVRSSSNLEHSFFFDDAVQIDSDDKIEDFGDGEREECDKETGKEATFIDGVILSWSAFDAYYLDLTNQNPSGVTLEQRFSLLKKIIFSSSGSRSIRVWHCKQVVQYLMQHSKLLDCYSDFISIRFQDPLVAVWVMGRLVTRSSLMSLCLEYLPHLSWLCEPNTASYMAVTGDSNATSPWMNNLGVAARTGVILNHLLPVIEDKLRQLDLWSFWANIEMPSMVMLAKLELNGLGFSTERYSDIVRLIQSTLRRIEAVAHQSCGRVFDLGSFKDQAIVLYKTLCLPPPSNWRQRLSKQTLIKLEQKHPLPGLLLKWRKLHSALNKMMIPFRRRAVTFSISKIPRIFPKCHTLSATGRVSMAEPSLQCVPNDMTFVLPASDSGIGFGTVFAERFTAPALKELLNGKYDTASSSTCDVLVSCRSVFMADSPNCLISADFCQLELRILAHCSGDVALLRLFDHDNAKLATGDDFLDPFLHIAKHVFKDDFADVATGELTPRDIAKKLCYAVIYGMGTKALAAQLQVTEKVALQRQQAFFDEYPEVARFIERTVAEGRRNGYVSTVSGRRRYLPNLNSTDTALRSQNERQAVNSTIQGSAADVVKAAMVQVERSMVLRYIKALPVVRCKNHTLVSSENGSGLVASNSRETLCAHFVLQLHDELMFEVDFREVDSFAALLRKQLQRSTLLNVPLRVRIKAGPDWGHMSELQP